MDRLANTFEESSRRWELIVYPSLFAFIILAAYGFFLLYSVTADMHRLSLTIEDNLSVLSKTHLSIAESLQVLSKKAGEDAVVSETMPITR